MLKRLKFPDHEVDLAIDPASVLFISLDRYTSDEGITVFGTTITFKDSANPTVGTLAVRSKFQTDTLKVTRLHTMILDELFK